MRRTPTKKARERAVFDAVYHGRMPADITPGERPDFTARVSDQATPFGVEIVDFFDSESEARLQRVPRYLDELLDHGRFRHKVDRCELVVDKVSVIDANGTTKYADIPAVIREVPSLGECSRKLAKLIAEKNAKLRSWPVRLAHVNLVIADRTGLLRHLGAASFYGVYYAAALREAARRSEFREIYFLTTFKSGEAFVPLKLMATLASLFMFHSVMVRDHASEVESIADLMLLFAAYLNETTTGPIGVRHDEGTVEVLCGDGGFIVDDQFAPIVRIYQDRSWPADARTIAQRALPVGIVEAVSMFEAENTFSIEIAFPVSSSADQR